MCRRGVAVEKKKARSSLERSGLRADEGEVTERCRHRGVAVEKKKARSPLERSGLGYG